MEVKENAYFVGFLELREKYERFLLTETEKGKNRMVGI